MFFKPAYVKDAEESRRLIKKIYFYRRSQLPQADLDALTDLEERFGTAIKKKDKAAIAKLEIEREKLLKRVGGHYQRHYHWFENTETLVVAAILAIGIRSFFLQPFKIPTNSMWPTYHGMTYVLRDAQTPPMSPFEKLWHFAVRGETEYRLLAPATGELKVGIFNAEERDENRAAFRFQSVTGHFLGIIPMPERQYVFYVGQTPVSLNVPADFSLDKMLADKYFQGGKGQKLQVDEQGNVGTGVSVVAGEPILDFVVESGDMLFADRISYNFTSPQVGDPIVFRTRNVPGLTKLNGGIPDDKYYIKRLVGLPGDILKVQGTTLYRNDKPITGSGIFAKNAQKQFPYPGYQAAYDLSDGASVTVPANVFYAFGDNSPESLDSRVWGGLPQRELVGRAVFIYYPFTERWGFSR